AAANDYTVAPAWARLRGRLEESPEPPAWVERLRTWVWRPIAVASAAAAMAMVALMVMAGGPTAVLIPIGAQSPPAGVRNQPGLFKDYTLIQQLDALENFDTVESEPLDDDQASRNG